MSERNKALLEGAITLLLGALIGALLIWLFPQIVHSQNAQASMDAAWNTTRTELVITWRDGPADASVYLVEGPDRFSFIALGGTGEHVLLRGGTDAVYAAQTGKTYILRTGDGVVYASVTTPPMYTTWLPIGAN
jgi:hypothetical protein